MPWFVNSSIWLTHKLSSQSPLGVSSHSATQELCNVGQVIPLSGPQRPASCCGNSSSYLLRACNVPGTVRGSPHLVFATTPWDKHSYHVYCIRRKLSTENWGAFGPPIPSKRDLGIFLGEICLGLCLSYLVVFFFFSFFFFFGCATQLVGSFLDQGLNPGPQQLECGVLTTGPPGNSLSLILWMGTIVCSRCPPSHRPLSHWTSSHHTISQLRNHKKRTWLGFWILDLHFSGERIKVSVPLTGICHPQSVRIPDFMLLSLRQQTTAINHLKTRK